MAHPTTKGYLKFYGLLLLDVIQHPLITSYFTINGDDVEVSSIAPEDPVPLLRRQLRWAYAELGCRCAFDERDIKTVEDSHCPIHGWQQPSE